MTKRIKYILAMAMAVLMTVATFGTVAVSAAAEETQNTNRVIYFENTKNWDKVYAYTWPEEGTADVAFPGTEAKMVGKVVRDGQTYEVFAYVLDADDDYIVFNEGFEHGQQSSDIKLAYHQWGDKLIVELDKDNKAIIGHYFNPATLLPC